MSLEPTIATSTLTFVGDSVHRTLGAHRDVVKAIWRLCFELTDSIIEVRVFPRETDAIPLHWNISISSPLGHRSIVATQRRPGAKVTFSRE